MNETDYMGFDTKRTPRAILSKAHRLGLCDKRKRKVWCAETDKTYSSITEAKKFCSGDIMGCLRNSNPHSAAGGYHWAYCDDMSRREALKCYAGKDTSRRYRVLNIVCVETGIVYSSVAECERITNQSIRTSLKNHTPNRQGYHYCYVDELKNVQQYVPAHQNIVCFETGKVYTSICDAKHDTGATTIRRCLKNSAYTSGGYHWCYEHDFYSGWQPRDKTIINGKKVICIETGVIYDSATIAMQITGISGVGNSCNDWRKTAGGYHWCWLDDIKNYSMPKTKASWNAHRIQNIDTLETFDSIKYVILKYTDISKSTLYRALMNQNKTAGGYHWKYINEENNIK